MISKKNRQIKRLKAQAQIKLRRAKTIHSSIKELNKYKYLTNANADQMIQNFNEMALDLFKKLARNSEKKTGSRYDKSIREFAVTLHFHSTRGYRYVRKTHCLPSPSTIRSWAANIQVEPGFLLNVIYSLEHLAPSDQQDSIIILDEMSLKAQTVVDRKTSRLFGNVDYGSIQGEPEENVATHVLAVMAAGQK